MNVLAARWPWFALVALCLVAIATLAALEIEPPEVLSKALEWILAGGLGGGVASAAAKTKGNQTG